MRAPEAVSGEPRIRINRVVAEATPLDEKVLCNIEKRAVGAEKVSH